MFNLLFITCENMDTLFLQIRNTYLRCLRCCVKLSVNVDQNCLNYLLIKFTLVSQRPFNESFETVFIVCDFETSK